eukprot:1160026-Pelagomonas_calceolata.AAC.6
MQLYASLEKERNNYDKEYDKHVCVSLAHAIVPPDLPCMSVVGNFETVFQAVSRCAHALFVEGEKHTEPPKNACWKRKDKKKILRKPGPAACMKGTYAGMQALGKWASLCQDLCTGVTSFVDLMYEYEIPIPDIQAASYATMDSDYTALRDAMWSGEYHEDDAHIGHWFSPQRTSRAGAQHMQRSTFVQLRYYGAHTCLMDFAMGLCSGCSPIEALLGVVAVSSETHSLLFIWVPEAEGDLNHWSQLGGLQPFSAPILCCNVGMHVCAPAWILLPGGS